MISSTRKKNTEKSHLVRCRKSQGKSLRQKRKLITTTFLQNACLFSKTMCAQSFGLTSTKISWPAGQFRYVVELPMSSCKEQLLGQNGKVFITHNFSTGNQYFLPKCLGLQISGTNCSASINPINVLIIPRRRKYCGKSTSAVDRTRKIGGQNNENRLLLLFAKKGQVAEKFPKVFCCEKLYLASPELPRKKSDQYLSYS